MTKKENYKKHDAQATRFASRRLAALRQARTAGKLDAVLISAPKDVRYLSGFAGEDSLLLIAKSWALLITDGRFSEQAPGQCPGVEVHTRTGPMAPAEARVLRGRSVRQLGLQGEHVTLAMRDALADAMPSRKLRTLPSITKKLRAIKDSGELKLIRQAIRIAQSAFLELTANGPGQLIGRTEGQVAAELEYLIRQAGAQGAAFDIIVAAGANSSKPHHTPGATRIKSDQPVLFDWGAKVGGYCSDLTRVVFPGKIPPKFREIYDIVRQAQQAGIDAVRASVRCTTPDAAARAVIEQAGYGEQFTHGLGHGIGLDVHEAPGLARKSAGGAGEVLRAGMVVTVEPGIYLPGLGGVRIEDDVLVTATGSRRLTRLGRRIQETEYGIQDSGFRSQ